MTTTQTSQTSEDDNNADLADPQRSALLSSLSPQRSALLSSLFAIFMTASTELDYLRRLQSSVTSEREFSLVSRFPQRGSLV